MKKNIFILFAFVVLLLGCEKKEIPGNTIVQPTYKGLTLSPSTLSAFSSDKSTAKIKVMSEFAWSSTTEQDWCKLSPSSGNAGMTEVTIWVEANENYDERNTGITITSGENKAKFTITQKQKDAILLSSSKVELNEQGGNFVIETKSNVSYSIEIKDGEGWLKQDDTSRSLDSKSYGFKVLANERPKNRQATIVFKSESMTETVQVYQMGCEPVFVLSQEEFIVPSEGQILQIELASNSTYSIQMPSVDWIYECESRGSSSFTHWFEIIPNESEEERTTEIIFINEDTGTKHPVNIVQIGKKAFVLAKSEYRLTDSDQLWNLELQAEESFDVIVDVDWISVLSSDGRALEQKYVMFSVKQNVQQEPRTGLVTLQGNKHKQTIKVIQSGSHNFIRVIIEQTEELFVTPQWDGNDVLGQISWGDGFQEWYPGIYHKYTSEEKYQTIMDIYNADSFFFKELGSINAITIYIKDNQKGDVEDSTVDNLIWD